MYSAALHSEMHHSYCEPNSINAFMKRSYLVMVWWATHSRVIYITVVTCLKHILHEKYYIDDKVILDTVHAHWKIGKIELHFKILDGTWSIGRAREVNCNFCLDALSPRIIFFRLTAASLVAPSSFLSDDFRLGFNPVYDAMRFSFCFPEAASDCPTGGWRFSSSSCYVTTLLNQSNSDAFCQQMGGPTAGLASFANEGE